MRTIAALLLFCFCASAQPKFNNYSHEITSGLVGWWKLNERTGTNVFDGVGFNNLVFTNSPVWTNGTATPALSLVNSDGCVGNGVTISPSSSMTISCWINHHSYVGYEVMICKRVGITAAANWDFDLDTAITSGGKKIGIYTGTNFNLSSAIVPTNVWWNVAIVMTPTGGTYYTNGVAGGTTTDLVGATNAAKMNIGSSSDGSNPFHGEIDDIRIYNRSLTAAELRYIYRNGGK